MSLADIFKSASTKTRDPFQDDIVLAEIIRQEADFAAMSRRRRGLTDDQAVDDVLLAARSVS